MMDQKQENELRHRLYELIDDARKTAFQDAKVGEPGFRIGNNYYIDKLAALIEKLSETP